MSYDKDLFQVVRHPLRARRLRVESTTLVTPRMQRVVLFGEDLEGFRSLAPEDHVKLFFPRPGETRPAMPVVGPLGVVLPRPGAPKPIARDYTPLHYDPVGQRISFDFFLHDGAGVAARWARQAEPGQELGVLGPRGSYVASQRFGEYLLVGDETALPEIEGRLRLLEPGARATAVLLVSDAGEQRPLASAAELDLRWVRRSDDTQTKLKQAVNAAVSGAFGGFVWLAGEASEVRSVYDHLVRVCGVEARRVHASGHWKRGVANHDHHEPIRTLEGAAS